MLCVRNDCNRQSGHQPHFAKPVEKGHRHGAEGVPCASVLERDEVGAPHTVLTGGLLLTGSRERVESFGHGRANKSGLGQFRKIACRLQSTCDSAHPKLNIVQRRGREFRFDHDVGKLDSTARAKDAVELLEDP